MLRTALVLALAVLSLPVAAQTQEVLFPGQEGDQLLTSVRNAYRPSSISGNNDDLYATIERTNVGGQDGVIGVYTGFFLPFDCVPSCDPSQDMFNNGQGINQEHTYPQSRLPNGLARDDLHNLFPTRVDVNGARGNLPFREILDVLTTRWYRDASSQTTAPPMAERDQWSELQNNTAFEPREVHEGNAARAMFYMRAVWAANDAAWFSGQLDDLYDWHRADRVDQAEVDRSARVAPFQSGCSGSGGCINPFVVDSTLARRAFFPGVGTSTEGAPEARLSLVLAGPNPVTSATTIRVAAAAGEAVRVDVVDALGRRVALLHEGPAPARALRLDASALPAGVLTVRALAGRSVATRRLVVAR